MAARKGDVGDLSLAAAGQKRIDWADQHMPVLRQVRQEFARTKPLKGLRVSACLHVTTETANLMRTLKAGGASVMLCASNPLSTQDDTAAALVAREGIPTYAIRGENNKTYYQHLHAVLGQGPTVTLDDGADLVSLLHTDASYGRAARAADRQHGRDHDRGHSPARHGEQRRAQAAGHRGQRRHHQASVR